MVLVASNFYESSLASDIISQAQQVTVKKKQFYYQLDLQSIWTILETINLCSSNTMIPILTHKRLLIPFYCVQTSYKFVHWTLDSGLTTIFQNPSVAKMCVFMWTLICISTLIFPFCPIRIVKTVLKHPNVLQYPSSQTLVRFIQSENDNNYSLLPEWGHDLGWN